MTKKCKRRYNYTLKVLICRLPYDIIISITAEGIIRLQATNYDCNGMMFLPFAHMGNGNLPIMVPCLLWRNVCNCVLHVLSAAFAVLFGCFA